MIATRAQIFSDYTLPDFAPECPQTHTDRAGLRRPVDPTLPARILAAIAADPTATHSTIADRCGCFRERVCQVARAAGIEKRRRGRPPTPTALTSEKK